VRLCSVKEWPKWEQKGTSDNGRAILARHSLGGLLLAAKELRRDEEQ